nr:MULTISPECIES: LysR substrate-binding domain-containing protein [unclassified Variovorax]
MRHLRYFMAVAEEAHFGRAAERLHIVQPALSMQIRALEEELGGPLFIRTSRRVTLTEAGTLFMAEARRTLDQAEHARETVRRALRGETGRVRVGFAGNAVFSGKLMSDLREFRKVHPGAELVVQEMAPDLQADAIRTGQLDIGYAPVEGLACDGVESVRIGSWPFVVAMPADHSLATRKRLTPKSIATQPLIVYAMGKADEDLLTALQVLIGRPPEVAYRVGSTLTVLALVAAGLGIAVVPAPVADVPVPTLVYRPIDALGQVAGLLLLSRVEETTGAVIAFRELARRKVKP